MNARLPVRRIVRRFAMLALPAASAAALGVLAASPAAAISVESGNDEVRIIVETDRAEVPIVDQFVVTLAVEAPDYIFVAFPFVSKEMGDFRLVRERKEGPFTLTRDGERIIRNERRYTLESTKSGKLAFPGLTMSTNDGRKAPTFNCLYRGECDVIRTTQRFMGRPDIYRTRKLELTITSILPPDADIAEPKDIAPPVALPPPPPVPVPWGRIAAAAGLAAVIVGALWLWRRRRRRLLAGSGASVPTRPAHELALQALERLEREGASDDAALERFHVALSGVLRRYLDWRFGVEAPRRTTEEFLSRVASAPPDLAGRGEALGRMLRRFDRIKFARQRPDRDEGASALGEIRRFVVETADESARVPVTEERAA